MVGSWWKVLPFSFQFNKRKKPCDVIVVFLSYGMLLVFLAIWKCKFVGWSSVTHPLCVYSAYILSLRQLPLKPDFTALWTAGPYTQICTVTVTKVQSHWMTHKLRLNTKLSQRKNSQVNYRSIRDPTLCSCRHSQLSVWAISMYCVG